MDVRIATATLTFADPIATAFGTLRTRELLLLRLQDATARWAGARRRRSSPTTASHRARCAMPSTPTRACCALATAARPPTCSSAAGSSADLPQALAAVDLALWDLAGNREGKPVCSLIADDPATEVRVNATIARRGPRRMPPSRRRPRRTPATAA